jgi:hypothetical protein
MSEEVFTSFAGENIQHMYQVRPHKLAKKSNAVVVYPKPLPKPSEVYELNRVKSMAQIPLDSIYSDENETMEMEMDDKEDEECSETVLKFLVEVNKMIDEDEWPRPNPDNHDTDL